MKQILSKAERDENDRRVGKALREYLEVGGQCRFVRDDIELLSDNPYVSDQYYTMPAFTISDRITETGVSVVIEAHTGEIREKLLESAEREEKVYADRALVAKKKLAALK